MTSYIRATLVFMYFTIFSRDKALLKILVTKLPIIMIIKDYRGYSIMIIMVIV